MFGFVSGVILVLLILLTNHLQVQLVPQLIINYKLKVWILLHLVCNVDIDWHAECRTYANESHDL